MDLIPVRRGSFGAEASTAFGEDPARSVVGTSVEDRERVVEAANEVGVEGLLVAGDERQSGARLALEAGGQVHAIAHPVKLI